MAGSVYQSAQAFEQLSLSGNAQPQGNLSITTPDNMTLVLNFNGFNNGAPSNLTPITPSAPPAPALEYSPSDSASTSGSSSPEPERAIKPSKPKPDVRRKKSTSRRDDRDRGEKEKDREPEKEKAAPSKETLKRFLDRQGQVHHTVSMIDLKYSELYPETWIRKKHYLSFTKHHKIRDVKFDSDCRVLLTSKHSVQLYDANGHFLERLYRDQITEPWGIHINTDDGHVYISDHKGDCVKQFNAIGVRLRTYGPVPSPCGVAVSTSGYVFVCSKADSCIYVFDKHGSIVKKIGEGTLTSPAYIILHLKSILVSEEARIIGFSTENEVEFVYGYTDTSAHPACLAVDKKTGMALATAYYKESVIAVRKDMHRALLVKEAVRPILCAQSQFGHLLVGERSSKGVVFKMYNRSSKN